MFDRKAYMKVYNAKYLAENRDKLYAEARERAAIPANKEKAIARATEWNRENKEKRAVIRARYDRNNLHLKALGSRKRRKLIAAQSCTCCTKEDLHTMYEMRPEGCHVDHIMPLSRGGAHCLSNMQFLPAALNWSKGARIES